MPGVCESIKLKIVISQKAQALISFEPELRFLVEPPPENTFDIIDDLPEAPVTGTEVTS